MSSTTPTQLTPTSRYSHLSPLYNTITTPSIHPSHSCVSSSSPLLAASMSVLSLLLAVDRIVPRPPAPEGWDKDVTSRESATFIIIKSIISLHITLFITGAHEYRYALVRLIGYPWLGLGTVQMSSWCLVSRPRPRPRRVGIKTSTNYLEVNIITYT